MQFELKKNLGGGMYSIWRCEYNVFRIMIFPIIRYIVIIYLLIVTIYSMIFILGPEVCSTLFDMLKTCSESPSMVSHLAKGIYIFPNSTEN